MNDIYRECYLCHEREKIDRVLLGCQKVTTYIIYDKLLMAFKITQRLRKKFPWINISCADLERGGGRLIPPS